MKRYLAAIVAVVALADVASAQCGHLLFGNKLFGRSSKGSACPNGVCPSGSSAGAGVYTAPPAALAALPGPAGTLQSSGKPGYDFVRLKVMAGLLKAGKSPGEAKALSSALSADMLALILTAAEAPPAVADGSGVKATIEYISTPGGATAVQLCVASVS